MGAVLFEARWGNIEQHRVLEPIRQSSLRQGGGAAEIAPFHEILHGAQRLQVLFEIARHLRFPAFVGAQGYRNPRDMGKSTADACGWSVFERNFRDDGQSGPVAARKSSRGSDQCRWAPPRALAQSRGRRG